MVKGWDVAHCGEGKRSTHGAPGSIVPNRENLTGCVCYHNVIRKYNIKRERLSLTGADGAGVAGTRGWAVPWCLASGG